MQDKLKDLDYKVTRLQFRQLHIEDIFRRISIDELHNSNSIEGNTLTYADTLALLNSDLNNLGKYKDSELLEILGYKEALEFIAESIHNTSLSIDFITELHYVLMKDVKPNYAGYIRQQRTDIVVLSNSDAKLVRGDVVPSYLDELIESYYYDIQYEHPVVAVARFKLGFVHCHPFFDGNGRTSRLLMNYLLLQLSMYPTIIRVEDRTTYFKALYDSTMGKGESVFIEWFVDNYIANLNNYLHFK